jgi:hypothetical protein
MACAVLDPCDCFFECMNELSDPATCGEQCTFNPVESEEFNDLRYCLLLGCPDSCP